MIRRMTPSDDLIAVSVAGEGRQAGLKSVGGRVDAGSMGLSTIIWLVIWLLIGWAVLMCLKTIGMHVQYGEELHELRVEAHRLRREHLRRLAALREQNLAARQALRNRAPLTDDELTGVDIIDDEDDVDTGREPVQAPMARAA